MITNRMETQSSPIAADVSSVRRPAIEDALYDTFLKMRELLDDYSPSWYPDGLREKVEAVAQYAHR